MSLTYGDTKQFFRVSHSLLDSIKNNVPSPHSGGDALDQFCESTSMTSKRVGSFDV